MLTMATPAAAAAAAAHNDQRRRLRGVHAGCGATQRDVTLSHTYHH